jgi:hypothetical protein
MLRSQRIAKLYELIPSVLRRIRRDYSVVQMDLDLSPTCMAVFAKLLHQTTVILFRGIKVSVNEGTAIAIAPRVGQPRILAAPEVNAPLLFVSGCAQHPIFRHNRGLEVIRHRNH